LNERGMEANVSALERAFHLARSGQVTDVKDIKAQLKPEGYDLGQITGIDDADWISALSAEGRWVVVSGDAKIARRKSEQAALPKLAADRLLLRSRIEQGEGDKANAEVACPLG
jgi:hypothetical protein